MPDREAFAAAGPPNEPSFWWKGEDLAKFLDDVASYGLENLRVELHTTGVDDEARAWLITYDIVTGERLGVYDYSHPCPPFCPNGD